MLNLFDKQEIEKPVNDNCETATNVTFPFSRSGSTSGALPDFQDTLCDVDPSFRGVWYKYEATEDRIVNIFTESYDFFHRITVFMGDSCGNNLSCHGTTVYNIFNLEYHFHAMRSTTYYILVTSGYSSSDVGAFSISVTVRTRCKKQRIFALFFTTKECSNTPI